MGSVPNYVRAFSHRPDGSTWRGAVLLSAIARGVAIRGASSSRPRPPRSGCARATARSRTGRCSSTGSIPPTRCCSCRRGLARDRCCDHGVARQTGRRRCVDGHAGGRAAVARGRAERRGRSPTSSSRRRSRSFFAKTLDGLGALRRRGVRRARAGAAERADGRSGRSTAPFRPASARRARRGQSSRPSGEHEERSKGDSDEERLRHAHKTGGEPCIFRDEVVTSGLAPDGRRYAGRFRPGPGPGYGNVTTSCGGRSPRPLGGSPAASPSAANALAISSISPIQRQPFFAAERSAAASRSASCGCERAHSAASASSTPSARAKSRIASRSAPDPFVHAAYAHLSADAFATIGVSIGEPSNSAATRCRLGAGEIETRRGRAADDAAVDEALDRRADARRGRRRHCVRVDVDAVRTAAATRRARARRAAGRRRRRPRCARRRSATVPASVNAREPAHASLRFVPPTPTAPRVPRPAARRRLPRPSRRDGGGRRSCRRGERHGLAEQRRPRRRRLGDDAAAADHPAARRMQAQHLERARRVVDDEIGGLALPRSRTRPRRRACGRRARSRSGASPGSPRARSCT